MLLEFLVEWAKPHFELTERLVASLRCKVRGSNCLGQVLPTWALAGVNRHLFQSCQCCSLLRIAITSTYFIRLYSSQPLIHSTRLEGLLE